MFRMTRIAAVCLLLAAIPVAADDDRAALREAVRSGQLVPLTQLIDWVQTRYFGEIIEVELERDDGFWVYEIELLAPTGAKIEFEFDARTGDLLEVEGRNLEGARR
jgi:uncharacterized membrane protein YkoI